MHYLKFSRTLTAAAFHDQCTLHDLTKDRARGTHTHTAHTQSERERHTHTHTQASERESERERERREREREREREKEKEKEKEKEERLKMARLTPFLTLTCLVVMALVSPGNSAFQGRLKQGR